MDSPLLIPLILIIILIIGLILLRQVRKSRRRGKRQTWLRDLFRKIDYGAHIAKDHGHERSSEWSRVAKEHLSREPRCVACGYKGKKLQVHHIKPFHLHPHLELDPDNLITLCQARGKEHHLLLGHLDSWKSYNEHVRADAKHFYRKTSKQIQADLRWRKKMMERP